MKLKKKEIREAYRNVGLKIFLMSDWRCSSVLDCTSSKSQFQAYSALKKIHSM